MSYGDRLKKARKYTGILEKELAERMGTTPQNVAQYESDKRKPRPENVCKMAKALQLKYAYTKYGEPFFYDFSESFETSPQKREKFNLWQMTDAMADPVSELTMNLVKKWGNLNSPLSESSIIEQKEDVLTLYAQYIFLRLNLDGKERALEFLQQLAENKKYKK